jgi:uncharacterized membrane protein YhaH (DUF805 family)
MASPNPYQTPARSSNPTLPATPGIKAVLFSAKGRIPRRTFWLWTLVLMAVLGVLMAILVFPIIAHERQVAEGTATHESLESKQLVSLAIFFIAYIPIFWASVCLQVKRWHDRGKSGAWFFINFIPYVGGLWVLVECGCLRGTQGHNQYGPDPT